MYLGKKNHHLRYKAANYLFSSLLLPTCGRGLGVKSSVINLNDKHLSVYEVGKGEPLVLLHGFSANKSMWLPLIRHLKNHYHIIAIDLPGHGDSSQEMTRTYNIDRQVEYLKEVIDHLGLAKFNLMGHSMGGAIASLFSYRYPRHILSLTLMCSAGAKTEAVGKHLDLLIQGDVLELSKPEHRELFIQMLALERLNLPRYIVDYLCNHYKQRAGLNRKILADLLACNYLYQNELYPEIKTPTLVLWGQKDTLTHPDGAHLIGRLIPNAEKRILPNIGHCPSIETPKTVADYFFDFSARVCGRSAVAGIDKTLMQPSLILSRSSPSGRHTKISPPD